VINAANTSHVTLAGDKPFINFYSCLTFYTLTRMNSLRLTYRSLPLIVIVIISLIVTISLVVSHILISLSYAQNGTIEKKVPINTMSKSKLPGIKIIFPEQGQRVSNDKNLTITGMSTYNSHTNCQVSIIVNNVRPYQHVNATGHNGANDYSTWKFPLSSKYTTVKAGLSNKATAKLTCNARPMNMTKFHSVNFTSTSTGASIPQAQLHTSKNNTNSTNSNKNNTKLLSIIGKQESNKPGNPSVSSTIDNHSKMISNKQKTLDNSMTSRSRTINHDNKSSIKSESSEISKDSTMNGIKDPFVLTLPTINDNLSSSSPPPELQSESHSKNNNEGSHHHMK
jgi:hypothetical protein